jgi:hypothetical protein
LAGGKYLEQEASQLCRHITFPQRDTIRETSTVVNLGHAAEMMMCLADLQIRGPMDSSKVIGEFDAVFGGQLCGRPCRRNQVIWLKLREQLQFGFLCTGTYHNLTTL